MGEKSEDEPVEVFSGSSWQTGMVKSILADAEIDSFLSDEILGSLTPWWTAPGGAGAIRVFVAARDYDRAVLIVERFENNLKQEDKE